MNIISFSLFGNNPKYCHGAIHNSRLTKEFFPDWRMRLYYQNIEKNILNQIDQDTELIEIKDDPLYGYVWRLYVAEDPIVDKYIVRDVDDRLNRSDSLIVKNWLESDKNFHVIRSIPQHRIMPAGMWGGKKCLPMREKLLNFNTIRPFRVYGDDEAFLESQIYPIIREDCIVYGFGSYPRDALVKPFPDGTVGSVGEVYEWDIERSKFN